VVAASTAAVVIAAELVGQGVIGIAVGNALR
jgi:hypothetical protein